MNFSTTLMFKKLNLLFSTVRYLKFVQVKYRIYYAVRKKIRKLVAYKYKLEIPAQSFPVKLIDSIPSIVCFHEGEFKFLNLSKRFDSMDWNYSGFGKLWTYNLNYFDYLNQPGMSKETGKSLILLYIEKISDASVGLEPFPISLRLMNWIKFLARNNIKEEKIDASIFAQCQILLDNIEYHILGNHLLENGFSLLYSAYYFQNEKIYERATKILRSELEEQILPDGAHFELSPMYHQIMLFRLLDCINLVQNNAFKEGDIIEFLQVKAIKMLGWIKTITFSNGNIPLFNDSAKFIAPTTAEIINYSEKLGIKFEPIPFASSGYRKFTGDRYEMIVDVGKIGPDYIPGHGHCDMLSFVLEVDREAFVIDTGTSTYEINERRLYEKSTAAHNTVSISEKEQSEIWSSFRVGKRADIEILEDSKNLKAKCKFAAIGNKESHLREFKFENNLIEINDLVSDKKHISKYFLHFQGKYKPLLDNNKVYFDTLNVRIEFENAISLKIVNAMYSSEFNRLDASYSLIVEFMGNLKSRVYL